MLVDSPDSQDMLELEALGGCTEVAAEDTLVFVPNTPVMAEPEETVVSPMDRHATPLSDVRDMRIVGQRELVVPADRQTAISLLRLFPTTPIVQRMDDGYLH